MAVTNTSIWFRGLNADRPAAPTALDQAWVSTDTGNAYVAKNTAGVLSWQAVAGGVDVTQILVLQADGSDPASFPADASGFDSASAAAAAGDVVYLPPGTISGDHTLTAGVEYVGAGRQNSVLTGQITAADGAVLRSLTILRAAVSSDALIGVLMAADGEQARVYDCNITIDNAGSGDAFAVEGAAGTLQVYDSVLDAVALSGIGYGAYGVGGIVELYDGVCHGSTADAQQGPVTPIIPPSGTPAFFADNGTNQAIFPNIISPMIYTYNAVTYVVWLGASFGTYIDAYDHATQTWHGNELVLANPGSYSDHSAPAVMVDDSGYLHVFSGGNNGATIAMNHTRSSNPEDITAWTPLADISTLTVYHSVVKSSTGVIFVFYWKKVAGLLQFYYVRSDESYTTEHFSLQVGSTDAAIYYGNAVYDEPRGRIWIMWCYYEAAPITKRRYMFVAYLNLSDSHWYGGIDNADMGTLADTSEWVAHCQLLGSTYETNHPNLFLDGSGNLHIAYVVNLTGTWQNVYQVWNGTSWGSMEVVTSAGAQFNLNDLFVNSDGSVDLYLCKPPNAHGGSEGGSLEHWQRSVGAVWSLIGTIFDISYSKYAGVKFPQTNRTDPVEDVVRVLFADDEVESTPVNDMNVYATGPTDAYIISSPGAGIFVNSEQMLPTPGITPMDGDRGAYDALRYPTRHASDVAAGRPTIHVPEPTEAGTVPVATSDGAGGFYWEESAVPGGTVTAVTGSAPISSTGGSTPVISLNDTAVTPGTYNGAYTVDQKGRLTAASNGGNAIYAPISNGSSSPLILNSNFEIILSKRA